MSYSFDYILKSTNLNDLFPELSNFELPDLSTKIGWDDWKNSRLAQFIDNGFEYLDLDKELFDRIFQGVFSIAKEDEAAANVLTSTATCEEIKNEPISQSQSPFIPESTASQTPAIETILIDDKPPHNNLISPNLSQFNIQHFNYNNMINHNLVNQPMINNMDNNSNNNMNFTTSMNNTMNNYNNIFTFNQPEEQKNNQANQPISTVAAIGRTFTSVYTSAINTAHNAWQNQSEEENKSAHWSNFVKKFTSFVSPGYMITLARDSAAYFQLKVPNGSVSEGWSNDSRLRRIYINRACANYGNSSKAREFANEEKGFILDCWVSSISTNSTRREKIRNCCSACALHWEKKGRSKKFPENNEKFVLIEASHEHVFEADGTHQIKLRSNCSSTCQNVKGKKLELNFSLYDLSLKREFFSTPISIRITRSGRSFEEPLTVDFS